jgi:dUTP pyrophosphatase
MIIEITCLREDSVPPDRANPSDAGMDVFFNPLNKDDMVEIVPGENRLLETGYSFGVPHGYMLQVCNRSSMAAKKGLVVGAHIVDAGYAGEVFIDLHNIGQKTCVVLPGDKIAQLVMVPVVHFRVSEVDSEQLYRYDQPIVLSNRGDGSLGSTGA